MKPRGGALIPLGMVVALAVALSWTARPRSLRAAPAFVPDTDGDGLVDAQEYVFGSSIELVDTDGDGFSDTEEVARNSSPVSASSIPVSGDLSVGLSARGEDGLLRILISVFDARRDFANNQLRIGTLVNGRVLSTPVHFIAGRAATQRLRTRTGEIMLLEYWVYPEHIPAGSSASWFVVVARKSGEDAATDVADLYRRDGVVLLRQQLRRLIGETQVPLNASVYRPIPPNGAGDIPTDWAPAEICFRTSTTVAAEGPILTQEVIAADCIPDVEAYCDDGCSNTIGYTYQTIDPVVLLGG